MLVITLKNKGEGKVWEMRKKHKNGHLMSSNEEGKRKKMDTMRE